MHLLFQMILRYYFYPIFTSLTTNPKEKLFIFRQFTNFIGIQGFEAIIDSRNEYTMTKSDTILIRPGHTVRYPQVLKLLTKPTNKPVNRMLLALMQLSSLQILILKLSCQRRGIVILAMNNHHITSKLIVDIPT